MADKIKLALAFVMIAAGIAGFYQLADSPLVLRVASVLAGLAAAAVVAYTSAPGKVFYAYAQDSIAETRKVVWPTRKETVQSTGLVMLFVIIMAIFLWIVDAILVWVVKLLLGTEA